MNRIFRPFLTIAIAVTGLNAGSARAQNQPPIDPAALGLDPTPFIDEELGVTLYHPRGAEVIPTRADQTVTITVRDTSDPPTYQMQIQRMIMRGLTDPTPRGVAAELLRTFRRNDPAIDVIDDAPRQVSGKTGHLLTLRNANDVGGYLIAPGGDDRYFVIRWNTIPEEFDQLRPTIEGMFQCLQLSTDREIKALREAQESLALQAIQSFTPERLREVAADAEGAWFRIYRPDPSGDPTRDEEIGYFELTVSEGRRGALTPARDPDDYTAVERESGMLVSIEARYLESLNPVRVADLQARLWTRWDRTDEAWTIRVTRRQGESTFTEAETAVWVSETGYQKLQVSKNVDRMRSHDSRAWNILPEYPYLRQAEVYVLGSLLPRDGSITGTMAFRAYDVTTWNMEELPIRLDTWAPATDGSGNWTLRSKPSPDMPEVVSTFDRHGVLLRREKGDGSVTEPIELRRLADLWKRKGLPTTG